MSVAHGSHASPRAPVSYGTDYNSDEKIHDDSRSRLIEFGTVFYDRLNAIPFVT